MIYISKSYFSYEAYKFFTERTSAAFRKYMLLPYHSSIEMHPKIFRTLLLHRLSFMVKGTCFSAQDECNGLIFSY